MIVDAEPGACLYAGLKAGVGPDQLRTASEAGTVADLLHRFEVGAGDCVFIPAGTVHAIGAGVVLAEIQQSSDLTFRLYDWGYRDPRGNPRQIHLDESIACTDFDRGPVDPVTPRPLPGPSARSERLVAGDFFVIDRHRADAGNGAFPLGNDDRFRVLMTLTGEATLTGGPGDVPLTVGRTVLVPAACPPLTVRPGGGGVTLLDSYSAGRGVSTDAERPRAAPVRKPAVGKVAVAPRYGDNGESGRLPDGRGSGSLRSRPRFAHSPASKRSTQVSRRRRISARRSGSVIFSPAASVT